MRLPLLLIPLLVAATPALAQTRVGDLVGTTKPAATTALAAQGYRMTAFEREDGALELKASSPAQRLELRVDPVSGKVTKVTTRPRGADGKDRE
ncbi:PepSY domain-containing protein [Phenylobacterium aquaticum]|uniref:PepSY domain-containing protein n=1 Tax=Phenylobacterium aquaticum TaxID=1763816 RepID=UPI001F5D5760|nr:PepSY domain-containing protein [Phenylobacterium aquaticum]MCI3133295.1 PepSY domain-containing protein [Phenylobacterium aquaticum]